MQSLPATLGFLALSSVVVACGGHANSNHSSGEGGSAGSSFVMPDDPVDPRLAEMPPTVVDNPTQTRLIELWISDSVYALFEDGTVYNWWYMADDSLAVRQLPPTVFEGLDGPSQIDRDAVLYEDGTARWWIVGADGARAVTQGIDGVDHAVYVSDDCALIRDGSVRCWGASSGMLYVKPAPTQTASEVDLPKAVELDSSLNSRCTLVRSADGVVTRFWPNLLAGTLTVSDVAVVELPSPAVRLFDGCAIPKTGAPRCYFVPGGMWDMISTRCEDTPAYDVTTPSHEHLSLASIGGNRIGVALGDSGTVYATLDPPDPEAATIAMKPLSGVGPAVFVRSGVYVSCAVVSPHIVCWSHEGTNAFVPSVVEW